MHFLVILAFPLTLAVFYHILIHAFCLWIWSKKPLQAVELTSYDSIRLLLDPPDTTTAVLLRARALPNARLRRAFEINNSTFTSSSTEVHRHFRRHAVERLRKLDHPDKWQTLGNVILGAVEFYLPDGPLPSDYAAYMQAIVFVTILTALFDRTESFPDASDVRFVTEGINTLWMDSKRVTSSPVSPTLIRINRFLHTWLPMDPADPFRENPLEIILPAYETLWRLVAHAYTYIEGSPDRMLPFLDFSNNPTTAQFRAPGLSEAPSAHEILQEVLRLHPPTKHIKRNLENFMPTSSMWIRRLLTTTICNFDSAYNTAVVADIEALQRSSVWGPSPHNFDAMRHRVYTQTQKECFMPFGLGPLKCVAASLAPRLAGMVVGGVARREDIKLTRGVCLGGRDGWGGWKIGKRL